jgi:protein-tyrosine-phosphatase
MPLGVTVESAGFIGPGRSSPEEAKIAAASRGIDLSRHRSRTLSPEMLRASRCVFAMEPAQARGIRKLYQAPVNVFVLGDIDSETTDSRRIPDPYDQPIEAFEDSYDRIDRCIDALVASVLGAT